MKMIPDLTFPERPYYETDELEDECERIIESSLINPYGSTRFPSPPRLS